MYARGGAVTVQSKLGLTYRSGAEVPKELVKDLVMAYAWQSLAAAQGNEMAQKAKEMLESSMTPAQIAEAQKLSRAWQPKR